MPLNGSGVFTPSAADFPAVAGTLIQSSKYNNVVNDVANNGLSNALFKDGQQTSTANQPMGGFKHTGVAAAAAAGQYARVNEVQDGSMLYGGTAGGTADALTITTVPVFLAYATGMVLFFKSGAGANTGAATLQVNGIASPKAIQKNGAALIAGDIEVSKFYRVIYDGTAFQIDRISLSVPVGPFIDSSPVVVGSADATKKVRFEVDGLTTATTRVLTMPDEDSFLGVPPDTTAIAKGSADGTKRVRLEVDGLTTGTTRVLTVADHDFAPGKYPTVQVLTSGSGTYNTPAGATRLMGRIVGGGGGGAGSGSASNGNGGNGGNTTFSTMTANGGSGAVAASNGGAGGTASGGDVNLTGATGGPFNPNPTNNNPSGGGGNSAFGGGGNGTTAASGGAGVTNTGGGGAGGGGNGNVNVQGNAGGGAGGYCEFNINSPAATYSYAVGAAGTGGAAGTSGQVGGVGGSGIIIIREFYD